MAAGLRRAVRPLAPAGRLLLDAVLPPRCLACGTTVAAPGALCAACWPALSFLTPPWCACCGYPFEYDAGPDALCAACIASPPPWRRARAALRYDEASRGLILAFKHGDRTEMAPALARWLAGAADLSEVDLVTAVPLHWRRLFARRYNQAALLAVTLPGVRGIVVLLLILWLGTFLTTGFEQFYLQRNAVGAQAAEVLDTFTYFRGVRGGDWGLAAAVGLLKGVVGAIVIYGANRLAKRFGEEGVF